MNTKNRDFETEPDDRDELIDPVVEEALSSLEGFRDMQRELRNMNDGLNFGDW